MMFTILSVLAELLIPLAAIGLSLSIPIVAIVFYYKHKSRIMDERKLMIEKGMAPPELSEQLKSSAENNSPMSKGMNMLAVALGILTGYFASQTWHTDDAISIICAILFWLGVANIIKSFLMKNNTGNYE